MAGPEIEAPNWDISVACDIRIGELFRTNPELQDRYLTVDTAAIQAILAHNHAEPNGSLDFTVMHDETLNEGRNPSDKTGLGVLGTTTTHVLSPGEPTEVKVAIGGSTLSLCEDDATSLRNAFRTLSRGAAVVLAGETVDDELAHALSQINAPVQSEETIQRTVVHELRHAADTKQEVMEDITQIVRKYWQLKLKPLVICGGVAAGNVIACEIANAPTFIGLIGAVTMGAVGVKRSREGEPLFQAYILFNRPREIKARQAEAAAPYLPKVITFKSLE